MGSVASRERCMSVPKGTSCGCESTIERNSSRSTWVPAWDSNFQTPLPVISRPRLSGFTKRTSPHQVDLHLQPQAPLSEIFVEIKALSLDRCLLCSLHASGPSQPLLDFHVPQTTLLVQQEEDAIALLHHAR